jgi:hypothetical protein
LALIKRLALRAYLLDWPEFRRLQSGIGAFRFDGSFWKSLLTV